MRCRWPKRLQNSRRVDGGLYGITWLDEIALSKGQVYSVTIIPSDDVPMDEKLLTFVDASTKAYRVPALLQEVAATLGEGRVVLVGPETAQRIAGRFRTQGLGRDS